MHILATPAYPASPAEPLEVPEERWADFLESFSDVHAGWRVTLTVHGPHGEKRVAAQDMALDGIAPDVDAEGHRTLCLALEPLPDVTEEIHVLPAPTKLSVERGDDGDGMLRIELARGSLVELRFRAPG